MKEHEFRKEIIAILKELNSIVGYLEGITSEFESSRYTDKVYRKLEELEKKIEITKPNN